MRKRPLSNLGARSRIRRGDLYGAEQYRGNLEERADGSSDYYQEPASPVAKKVIMAVFWILLLAAVAWFLWPFVREAVEYMK